MKKINWRIRFRDPKFVISFLGLIFLLAKQIVSLFGIDFDYTIINSQLTEIVNTAFTILFLIGVVADPTTKGLRDSKQARLYKKQR